MSSQLKKKAKQKKKKKDEEEIVFVKHEKIGNLNVYSEEISKNIIEIIISHVISSISTKNVENKFSDFCFNEAKKNIDNIIELMNLNHDVDDFDIDKIDINSTIKYYNTDSNINRDFIKRHNVAIELRNDLVEENLMNMVNIPRDVKLQMLLKNQKIQDCLNKSIIIKNNKYLKRHKIYQFSLDTKNNNFWGDIPIPKVSYIDRTSSRFNNFKPRKSVSRKSKITLSKEAENSKKKNYKRVLKKAPSFRYKNFVKNFSKNFAFLKNDNKNKDKDTEKEKEKTIDEYIIPKRRVKMSDLPSFPLEYVEERKESDEITNLRMKTLEILEQKEKEIKKSKVEVFKIKKEEAEKEKKIKKGNFTYDSEGNIVFINKIDQRFLNKEFYPIYSKQKDINVENNIDIVKKEYIKMEKNAKKFIQYNNDDKAYNSFITKLRLSEPLVNLSETKIENLNNNKNDIIDSENLNKIKKKFEDLFTSNFSKRVEPSGSNFQLINPSIGVIIKDKDRQKSGGNDFYKKFQKYSINEFNKTLQGKLEWRNYENKQFDEYNIASTVLKNNLDKDQNKDTNLIINSSEFNSINGKFDIKNKIQNIKNARNVKNQNKKNNYKTIYSDISSKKDDKKRLLKSTSEIHLSNEKLLKLKEILFHDKNDKVMPYIHKQKNSDLFEYKNKSSIRNRNKHIKKFKNMFYEVDNFNENLVKGIVMHEKSKNNSMVLPKISKKNNETNFNKTMLTFNRERTKNNMWEKYIQKKEKNKKMPTLKN